MALHPILIIIFFFGILAGLIALTADSEQRRARFVLGIAAFGWACLMFLAASWAESLNYNIWYSGAARKMLAACISSLEEGEKEAVLQEMRRMTNELYVTYMRRGNFQELAERTAASLTKSNGKKDVSTGSPPPSPIR